jgi:1-deoxy-D-xylulose-5-phosphate reductoisomerase
MVKTEPGRKISVSVLGATGSVGKSALDLIARNPERYEVVALTAKRDAKELARLARDCRARLAVVAEQDSYLVLSRELEGSNVTAAAGRDGMLEAARLPTDVIVAAISGAAGLEPTLAALTENRCVALANKECLVSAGSLFMRAARERGATVLPVDSEHNAIFQALMAGPRESVEQVTITGSGGPFRTRPVATFSNITPEEALRHPTWSMGAKITIDSATLMNKGLELIEAHHLFGLAPKQLDVVIHPQSVVHALVEYRDGAVLAALSMPDMRIPLACCLGWPSRPAWAAPRLDLAKIATLTFEAPDRARFPALQLACEALEAGGAAPTVLNAANEVAVEAFLARQIGFNDIPGLVRDSLERSVSEGLTEPASAGQAIAVDHVGRSIARTLLPQFAAKAS